MPGNEADDVYVVVTELDQRTNDSDHGYAGLDEKSKKHGVMREAKHCTATRKRYIFTFILL